MRESHRRTALCAAVGGIRWADGAADINPPRAHAIVFETYYTLQHASRSWLLKESGSVSNANFEIEGDAITLTSPLVVPNHFDYVLLLTYD